MKTILLLLLLLLGSWAVVEGFNPSVGFFGGPISSGTTRNMSYDIRGDPFIAKSYVGPWNISTIRPIRNRPLGPYW